MDCLYVPEEELMHRFYGSPDHSSTDLSFLTPEDAHHAIHVLRMKPGDEVELIENGKRFLARIESMVNGNVVLSKENELPSTEAAHTYILFQGLPKGDKMEWIIQKSVELGIARIVPVIMSRCVVKLNEHDSVKKQERWQKIAREAGKQSGRCRIPEVTVPVNLHQIPDLADLPEHVVIPWEEKTNYGPQAFFRDHPTIRSLGIVIGPEGGIDPDEIRILSSLPSVPITLGRRILRTETAGIAAVSALMALYGEME